MTVRVIHKGYVEFLNYWNGIVTEFDLITVCPNVPAGAPRRLMQTNGALRGRVQRRTSPGTPWRRGDAGLLAVPCAAMPSPFDSGLREPAAGNTGSVPMPLAPLPGWTQESPRGWLKGVLPFAAWLSSHHLSRYGTKVIARLFAGARTGAYRPRRASISLAVHGE